MNKDYRLANQLLEYIGQKNVLQNKYLKTLFYQELTAEEKEQLEDILCFLSSNRSIEELAEAYLMLVDDMMKETKYFIEHGHYRYSSFDEVEKLVYSNRDYMNKYMLGLQISGYIWKIHLTVHRWFLNKIKEFSGKRYLEIGPGHGQYFLEAMNLGKFEEYTAIDVSATSIQLVEKFIEQYKRNTKINYKLICADVIDSQWNDKFDAVSMSEVLEHLEEPEKMLNKIYEITTDSSNVYITVPVNGPSIDHIYLFNNMEEVFEMVKKAGFFVKDYIAATENNISLEKAIKKKQSIILALHLVKSE